MTTLYGQASQEITLTEALEKCADCFAAAVGLFYSPIACCFGKVQKKSVTGSDGNQLDLKLVFEARIFNQDAELRWLNESGGEGRAVLLSEIDLNSCLDESLEKLEAIDVIDNQPYVLWGEVDESSATSGWSRLSAARIGRLDVPIGELNKKTRVQLKVLEYLKVFDDHGNVVVAEERLLCLEVHK